MIKLNYFWIDMLKKTAENFGGEIMYMDGSVKNINTIDENNDYYINLDHLDEYIWNYMDEEKMKTIMKYCDMEYDENIDITESKQADRKNRFTDKEHVLLENKKEWGYKIFKPNTSPFNYYVGEPVIVNDTQDISLIIYIYYTSIFLNPTNQSYSSLRLYMKKNNFQPVYKNAASAECDFIQEEELP